MKKLYNRLTASKIKGGGKKIPCVSGFPSDITPHDFIF